MALKKNNKTLLLTKEQALADRKWFLFDVSGKTLGRLASEIAKILCGKHKVNYTPHVDTGDGVVIINAGKIVVTGAKEAQKVYRYYTGMVGGQREIPYRVMKDRKPEYIIRHAVKGMMPKTRLGEAQMKKLRIFAGETHDLAAQKPVIVNI
jgi:large subunit ribosomal protein L13